MKILITGGTGFIGKSLCAALTLHGNEITVLSRTPQTVPAKCGSEVRALATLGEWHPDMHFDVVINLAGEPIADAAWTPQQKQKLRESRVVLTEKLVAAIARTERRPDVLLSGSAVGYYGNRGDTMIDESAPSGDDFAATLCRDWEAAARGAEVQGVRVCLLRTGLVLHPEGGLLGRLMRPFRFGLGARLGDGRQWMSWIARDDYIDIVLSLLRDPHAIGPYNMTAPTPVTNADFTMALGRALHRPAVLFAPSPLLRLALGERAPMLLGGQRVLPTRVQSLGYRFLYPQIDGALQTIGKAA